MIQIKCWRILQAVADVLRELDCSFPVVKVIGSIAAALLLALVLLIVGFLFRGEIKIILYMKLGLRLFDKKDDNICGKVRKWLSKLWYSFAVSICPVKPLKQRCYENQTW